jgi:hypothetical protein
MKAGSLVFLVLMAAMAAHAEEATQLPPITLLGTPRAHGKPHRPPPPPPQPTGTGAATDRPANERCVDVTVGGERSFGCINQLLKEKVVQTNPTMNTPPIDARSPDLKPAL